MVLIIAVALAYGLYKIFEPAPERRARAPRPVQQKVKTTVKHSGPIYYVTDRK